jgi:hypothetical protein
MTILYTKAFHGVTKQGTETIESHVINKFTFKDTYNKIFYKINMDAYMKVNTVVWKRKQI